MARVLIVDDDKTFQTQISLYIEEIGHEWKAASNLEMGLAMASAVDFDLVFLDIYLPDASGLDGINKFRSTPCSPEVIIVTGHSDPESAEIALQNGAWDYLTKPPEYADFKLLLTRALDYRATRRISSQAATFKRNFIIGNAPGLLECLEMAARAASTRGNVLITGETGTGKELIAQAIHINSNRRDHEMVVVDCTNITDTLASSLLFGYRKGAFTGADKNTEGLISQANKSTLFMDEIGDFPLETQKTLLRVLQTRTYRPLGAKHELECDFRVISATNRDIRQAIRTGMFREDLFHRLSTFHIHLPPLRERPGDIQTLSHHFIREICHQMEIDIKGVSVEFMKVLAGYEWPGNIRELYNVLQTSISSSVGEPILIPQYLPLEMRIGQFKKEFGKPASPAAGKPSVNTRPILGSDVPSVSFKEFRDRMERGYLHELLDRVKWNIPEACRVSGLSRARLYQLFQKHGLNRKQHESG